MGITESNSQSHTSYDKLIFLKSLGHEKSLMADPNTNEQYVTVESTFPSELQMEKFCEELKERMDCPHQYYMGPLKHIMLSSSNICSKQYKVIQIFSHEDYTLHSEIESRKKQSRNFTDRQVWSILCSCVLAMSFLTKNQIQHLTLHPKDIILSSDGSVKIAAVELSQYQFDYTYKPGFYYSPQTLRILQNKIPTPNSNNNKAGVFTLAITIMSTILTEDLSYLYSDNCTLDYQKLTNVTLPKISNEEMRGVLSKMLKLAPYQRISFTELEEMLYNILEKQKIQNQQEQIEKLNESIYRMKIAGNGGGSGSRQGNGGGNKKKRRKVQKGGQEKSCENDAEDSPNSLFPLEQLDVQNVDEKQNGKNKSHDELETCNNSRMWQDAVVGPLAKKNINSNTAHQSKQSLSLHISEDKAFFDCFTEINSNKTSRESGPYYVTEQYSRGRYEGYKENSMRHGFGTFFYEQGGKYSGEWFQNKMQGRGALYYANGELAYQGQWNKDQLQGYGVLYNESPVYTTAQIDWKNLNFISSVWIKYEGNFSNDLKCGEGTLYLSNGEYYRGEFKQDLPDGKGIFRISNGELLKGYWSKGVFLSFEQ